MKREHLTQVLWKLSLNGQKLRWKIELLEEMYKLFKIGDHESLLAPICTDVCCIALKSKHRQDALWDGSKCRWNFS